MKRVPSIHITKSDFNKIVKELTLFSRPERERFVEDFFRLAKPKAITTRKLIITNELMAKKAKRASNSSNEDTFLFINSLMLIRRLYKHRGLTPIKEGSKDWLICKDLTVNAISFCEDFNLPKKEGFVEYCKTAMTMMQKFYLAKMTGLHEGICQNYEANLIVKGDKNPDGTNSVYIAFQRKVINEVGATTDHKKYPNKYQYFVKARELADSIGLRYDLFIEAQFKAFSWRNGLPEPVQITGDKALERAIKYAFENGIPLKKNNNELVGRLKAIKTKE